MKFGDCDQEEIDFLKWLHRRRAVKFLSEDWPLIQGGAEHRARTKWPEVMDFLELDDLAQKALFLCAHQGLAGRTIANQLLWDLLSKWSNTAHKDLSQLLARNLEMARHVIDRPPDFSKDLQYWTWSRAINPPPQIAAFSPKNIPGWPDRVVMYVNPLGQPLPPPSCWAPPGPPRGPPPADGAVPPPHDGRVYFNNQEAAPRTSSSWKPSVDWSNYNWGSKGSKSSSSQGP
jgi:hypothetical protein